MLISQLLIDLSNLRDERNSGEISQEEYEKLRDERREQFKEDEQDQFIASLKEQERYIQELKTV